MSGPPTVSAPVSTVLSRRSLLAALGAAPLLQAGTRLAWGRDEASGRKPADWLRYGYDRNNSRFNAAERRLNPTNVGRLKLRWTTEGTGPTQNSPIIVGDRLCYTNWNHELRAVAADTGRLLWKFAPPGNDLLPPYEQGIRDTPHCEQGRLYVVDSRSHVHCLDAGDGKPLWETALDQEYVAHAAHTRCSPNGFDGRLIVGNSGMQPQIACLEMASGRILWRFYTGPGGSLWTSPAIDAERRVVYNVTGDPKAYTRAEPTLYSNSILAQDLDSGELLWYRQAEVGDTFNMDFSTHPMLFDAAGPRGTVRECVGAGNKRGFYVWDRNTGEPIWKAALTPAHAAGGPIADSTAVAYNRVYLTSNALSAGRPPSSVTACLNAFTGGIEWWAHNTSMVSAGICVANGVMFQGQGNGTLQALDAESGRLLWEDKVPSMCRGVVVANGTLYAAHGESYVQSREGGARGPAGYAIHAFGIDA